LERFAMIDKRAICAAAYLCGCFLAVGPARREARAKFSTTPLSSIIESPSYIV